jgi:hypothetical protein
VSVQAQERWDIRCEWGAPGLAALAPASDVVVARPDIAHLRGNTVECASMDDVLAALEGADAGAEYRKEPS